MHKYFIKSKKQLNDVLQYEKEVYFGDKKSDIKQYKRRHVKKYEIWKYLFFLRKYEYWCYRRDNSKGIVSKKLFTGMVVFYDKKRNIQGGVAGIEVVPFTVGKGLKICHGGVVINGYVGDDCVFHGNNIVGNKRTGEKEAVPEIGRGVDIGAGAVIIGKVKIANGCLIGAGAVVTKSFEKEGAILTGVPAKELIK